MAITVTIMATEITIDGTGRIVIPKGLRDRLQLAAGTTLTISEDDGRLVLVPGRQEPRLAERNGFLVVELEQTAVPELRGRDERLADLIAYAVRH